MSGWELLCERYSDSMQPLPTSATSHLEVRKSTHTAIRLPTVSGQDGFSGTGSIRF